MSYYIGILMLFTLAMVGVLAVGLCLAARDRRRNHGDSPHSP